MCSLTEEDGKPDPANAGEYKMSAGRKQFSHLFENTAVYMPGESGPNKVRVVICPRCGCVYAKEA